MKSILLSFLLLWPIASQAADVFNPANLTVGCQGTFSTELVMAYLGTEIASDDCKTTERDSVNDMAKLCEKRKKFLQAKILSAKNQNKLLALDITMYARFYDDDKIGLVDPDNNSKAKEAEIERRMKDGGVVKCDFVANGYARKKVNFPGCGYNSALAIRDVSCKDEMGGKVETRALCSLDAEKKGATDCYAESISYDVVRVPSTNSNGSTNTLPTPTWSAE